MISQVISHVFELIKFVYEDVVFSSTIAYSVCAFLICFLSTRTCFAFNHLPFSHVKKIIDVADISSNVQIGVRHLVCTPKYRRLQSRPLCQSRCNSVFVLTLKTNTINASAKLEIAVKFTESYIQ